ncbi:AHH domain-containing protein [Flavobacterium sp.]|uniref:AHH domain-containing protein n=1 Tax=Flavobacterium sp. TaxID=239 RepID=UPI003F6988EA
MKTKLKIFKFIALLALFNSFYSCQEDEILIESDNKTFELKTSKVSINQVISEINSQSFKQKLQSKNFDSSISNSLLRTSDSDIYFIKKEKDDELISYILHLNSYTQSKPYFLKLIITQNNNETERMGYIKYIPTTPISILDMSTFSGEVQILDNNFEVNATSNYVNGVKQENLQNNGTQNRIICTDEIVITEVRCSHGGNHGVGQSCNNGLVNDAHYVISIFTRCTGDRTTPTQIIDDYGNPNSDGTSSVNVGLALAHNFSLNLTSEQKLIYDLNQSIAVYLADNVIVVPDPSYNPILGGNPTMPIIDPQAEQFVLELIDYVIENNNVENQNILNELVNVSLYTYNNGGVEQLINNNYLQNINQYTQLDFNDPTIALNFVRLFVVHCATLKQENPTWTNWQVFKQAYVDTTHLVLDLAGLVPAIGEVADLANGIIYTIEGDGVNATLSFASTIPVAGWFSAGVKFAKRADGLKFLVKGANNLIDFGAYNSKKFRAACGIAVGDATKQAHHIIPRGSAIIEHSVVQKAAKSNTNQGFHIDQALNGVKVDTWRNQPNHNAYNNLIKSKLDALPTNLTPNQAYAELMDILNQAKQAVINNPNVHINDLVF